MPVTSVPATGVNRRDAVSGRTVLQELERLHGSLQPGETFPSRRELMGRLGAAEHVVRSALDELERQGKIIRRVGRGGSIVAEGHSSTRHSSPGSRNGFAAWDEGPDAFERTILAIGEPDGAIFDQAMGILVKQAKTAKLAVHCRFMQPEEMDQFTIPRVEDGKRKFVVFRRHFLPLASWIQAAGHQVVFVGTPYSTEPETGVPSVFGDQEQGGYLAVRHMVELGHRRIALHIGHDYRRARRWDGWQRALAEYRQAGIKVHGEILDISVNEMWRGRHDLVRRHFTGPSAPTAVISWNDNLAIELLTLLLSSGLRVPSDVSLLGYDNMQHGAELHPALSTIDGGLEAQIQAALRILSLPKVNPNHQVMVIPTPVIRESTVPPRPT